MAKKFEYKTILLKGSQNYIYVDFPFDGVAEFATRKAVRVKVTIDNFPYEMSLLPGGKGKHWLHVKKVIREEIGKEEGDTVLITVEKDESPKKIDVPEYLQWLLENDREMEKKFRKMPYSAKKFWTDHVSEAKSDDTKVERINHLFDFLRQHY